MKISVLDPNKFEYLFFVVDDKNDLMNTDEGCSFRSACKDMR